MAEFTTDTIQDIRSYIDAGKLLNVATTDGESLHMCSVWYAPSEDRRRFYFTSRTTRVHSENIRRNGRVGGSIIAIELEGLGQKTRGLFFSGTATEADASSVSTFYEAYRGRWPQVDGMFTVSDIVEGSTPMQMYEVRPTRLVWIDEVRSPTDPRFEIPVTAI